MVYSTSVSLSLGSGKAGQTLKAQLVDTLGVAVGVPITTNFVEIGGGSYLWTNDNMPDNFRGGIKFLDDSNVLLAFTGINPEEVENTNVKSSSIKSQTDQLVFVNGKVDSNIDQNLIDSIITTMLNTDGFTTRGDITIGEVLRLIVAMIKGKIEPIADNTYRIYDDDGLTKVIDISQTALNREEV